MDKEQQIQKYEKQGLEVLGTTEEMQGRLEVNTERLGLVHTFIDDNFRKGIDFGPADPRNPKPTLLKPGAERLCKLFNTRPTWRMDEDTWRMLGQPNGVVCYICEIVDNNTGEVIGEGRGAEKVGNKGRDQNKAIKAAQKCSLVDAALYTFGLSERFTQDGAPDKNNLDTAKDELRSFVEDLRMGVESDIKTNRFIQTVVVDFTNDSTLNTVGAVRAVRRAIEKGRYNLSTGRRAGAEQVRDDSYHSDADGGFDPVAEMNALAAEKWPVGSARMLRSICDNLGIDLDNITPSEASAVIDEMTK